MKIEFETTLEEAWAIRALAIEKKTTPEKIVQQFVSELTGSRRSNGSDERAQAESWFNRTFMRFDELTDKEREKIEQFQSLSYEQRTRDQVEWQKKLAKRLGKGGAK